MTRTHVRSLTINDPTLPIHSHHYPTRPVTHPNPEGTPEPDGPPLPAGSSPEAASLGESAQQPPPSHQPVSYGQDRQPDSNRCALATRASRSSAGARAPDVGLVAAGSSPTAARMRVRSSAPPNPNQQSLVTQSIGSTLCHSDRGTHRLVRRTVAAEGPRSPHDRARRLYAALSWRRALHTFATYTD